MQEVIHKRNQGFQKGHRGYGGNISHGFAGKNKHSFYKKWEGMRCRCGSNDIYYNEIEIMWNSFEEFRNDMYESYELHVKEFGERNTTIDRINSKNGYSKENCRWATIKEQARNRRNNKIFTFNQETHCLSEWAEILKIDYHIIYQRIFKLGWTFKESINK